MTWAAHLRQRRSWSTPCSSSRTRCPTASRKTGWRIAAPWASRSLRTQRSRIRLAFLETETASCDAGFMSSKYSPWYASAWQRLLPTTTRRRIFAGARSACGSPICWIARRTGPSSKCPHCSGMPIRLTFAPHGTGQIGRSPDIAESTGLALPRPCSFTRRGQQLQWLLTWDEAGTARWMHQ
jgi:hypothetical protein